MNILEAARWLAFADSDLKAGRALLNDPDHFPRQVCFFGQQSAEKALKAILILLNIEFPFTHDLDRLRDLIPDGWRVKAKHPDLAGLTVWAVEARYPGDMPGATEAETHESMWIADAVYQAVAEDLHQYLKTDNF